MLARRYSSQFIYKVLPRSKMPAFTFYDFPASTNAKRVHLVLAEGGITDYERKVIHLFKGEQKSPDYVKLNPWGKVPTLTTENGLSIYESRAICKYLVRKYSIPLIPAESDIEGWALFDQAESVEMLYFGDPASKLGFEKFTKKLLKLPVDETAAANALKGTEAYFDAAEKQFEHKEYMAGPKFSLVDLFYIPIIIRLFEAGHEDIIRSRPAVNAWWERCTSRPAIAKQLAEDKAAMGQIGK